MKRVYQQGMSFVEILMTITILSLISIIAYTSFGVRQNTAINTKITSEISSLGNALELIKQEKGILPQPKGNRNFYAIDTSYIHDYDNPDTFGVHGFITHDTLPKKYIDIVPVDPRTGSFYAYGKTKGTETYEISGVVYNSDIYSSIVTGSYTAESGPLNLIREYNGPNFVSNKSQTDFPYNPNERILTAKIDAYTGGVTINGNTLTSDDILSYELKSGDEIEVIQNGVVELYYSDGSRSVLGDSSNPTKLILQKLEFTQENNLITKVQLILESGMIWNKAANLDNESGFEIYTTDTTAAVRGTIFGVQKNSGDTQVVVKQGKVAVKKNESTSISLIQVSLDNNDVIPSTPLPEVPGLIDIDGGESVIEVVSGTEKGVYIGDTTIPVNITNSISNIPTIIRDEVIENSPIVNENITIGLNEYKYNQSENIFELSLAIPKNIYNSADALVFNNSYILEKLNWGDRYSLSGSVVNHMFDGGLGPIVSGSSNNSIIPSPQGPVSTDNVGYGDDGVNERDDGNDDNSDTNKIESFIPSIIPSSYASNGNNTYRSVFEYIKNSIVNGRSQFDIQVGKYDINGNLRLTNKVRITVIDEREFKKEEKVEIDKSDIEKEKKPITERGQELCHGFMYDDGSGDTCAQPDRLLANNGWQLVGYAPYDTPGDLNLYKSGGIWKNNYYDNSGHGDKNYITSVDCGLFSLSEQCTSDEDNFGAISYNPGNSFVDYGDRKGIFLDSELTADGGSDKLKYLGVNLNGNYIIEAVVNGESLYTPSTNRYIINNSLDKGLILSTNNIHEIYRFFYNASNTNLGSNEILVNQNTFYTIRLTRDGGSGKVEIFDDNNSLLVSESISNIDFNTIIVGSRNNYIANLGGVIDFVKIYNK